MMKAILLDIDGTLVNSKQQITDKTKKALLKAQEDGIRVILASGRPINGMMHLAKELEMEKHHGLCVCFNGARVVDCQTKEVLFNQTMSLDLCKEILNHLKKFDGVWPLIVKDEYAYVNNVYNCMVHVKGKEINIINHEAHDNNFILCEKRDLAEFVEEPLNKIMAIAEPEILEKCHEEISAPFKGKVNAMFTAPFYYEITNLGIDKVKAMKQVFDDLGITFDDCIAFGDAQNDQSMVEHSKVGVAMGNACDSLKAVADYVTDSNEEDGIANALEKFL